MVKNRKEKIRAIVLFVIIMGGGAIVPALIINLFTGQFCDPSGSCFTPTTQESKELSFVIPILIIMITSSIFAYRVWLRN